MKTIMVLVAAWLAAFGAVAQARPTAAQHASSVAGIVVSVSAGVQEYGSGFVVGSTADSVYVATAGHVLKQPAAVVKVRLEGITAMLPARVRFFRANGTDDLALLAVASKGFRYQQLATYDGLTSDDDLWFVSTQAQDSAQALMAAHTAQLPKTVLPRYGAGAKQSADGVQHTISFVLLGIKAGDSGSALLTKVGSQYAVVGMILDSSELNTAVSIAYLKSIFLPRLGAKWQLPLLQPSN